MHLEGINYPYIHARHCCTYKTTRTAKYALNFRCCCFCCCNFISFYFILSKAHVYVLWFSSSFTIYTLVFFFEIDVCAMMHFQHWRNCHKSYLFFELGTFILFYINKVFSFLYPFCRCLIHLLS